MLVLPRPPYSVLVPAPYRKCNQGNHASKIKDRSVNMASRARTRLTLNEVLSGVFDDDFGLSDDESSDEEGAIYLPWI